MNFHFSKYHAGKDFILLDNREGAYSEIDKHDVFLLCDRHFGVGADGLILLNSHSEADFENVLYYPNGLKGEISGNGNRCAVAFAKEIGVVRREEITFLSNEQLFEANFQEEDTVEVSMPDVTAVDFGYDSALLNTGSKHYVKFTEYLGDVEVTKEGKEIRNQEKFKPEGVNVSYLEYGTEALEVRTYEKGVEDEVPSSGTGAIACAIIVSGNQSRHYEVPVKMKGGDLLVHFDKISQQEYKNIRLSGLAEKVFEGEIDIKKKWKERVALYDKIVGLKV